MSTDDKVTDETRSDPSRERLDRETLVAVEDPTLDVGPLLLVDTDVLDGPCAQTSDTSAMKSSPIDARICIGARTGWYSCARVSAELWRNFLAHPDAQKQLQFLAI